MAGENDGRDGQDPNVDDIPAGAEVPDDFVDDAERDAAAAQGADGGEGGDGTPKTREEVMAEMREAMANPPEDDAAAPARKAAKDKAGDDGAKPDDGKPAGGKPAGGKPAEGAKPDGEAKPDDEKAKTAAAEKAEAERKAAVDKEADELKLKGRTRDRFHELSKAVHEKDTALKAFQELHEDPAKLKEVLDQHVAFEDAIFSTGLTTDDFKNVAGYKAAIQSNDPQAWQNAREFLLKELAWLETERMGIKAPDGKDPYTLHEDLVDDVRKGEISQARANEIAQARNLQASAAKVRTESAQTLQQQQAEKQGQDACVGFAQRAAAANPAEWQAKFPILRPKLAEIQEKFPPDQWADRMELEYGRIPFAAAPAPAAPTQTVRVGALPRGGGTRRPGGAAPGDMREDKRNQDPMAALREGLGIEG